MSQSIYIKKINDKLWSAAALLKIEALPLGISGNLAEQVLMSDTRAGVSFELFINSGSSRKDAVEMYLLIRSKGLRPAELTDMLEKTADSVQYQLKYAGFMTSRLHEEAAEDFDKKLMDRRNIILAVPGENARNFRSFYAPGGYDAMKEIDLPYLASVISGSVDAGLSIQASTTMLLPEEQGAAAANLEWLNSIRTDESVRGMEVFSRIWAKQNGQVFFLCLTIWGDESVTDKLLKSIRVCGYSALAAPSDVFFGKSYLTEGDRLVQDLAAGRGHIIRQGMAVPRGCERMNYLTDISEIVRMLRKGELLAKTKGIAVNQGPSIAGSTDDVPDEYFDGQGVDLGKLAFTDRSVYLPEKNIVKHAVITGMPGSGKTSLIFHILKELYDKKTPFIAVEPTKNEYREMIDAIPDLKVYTPGRTDVSPFMFNPFLPPENITLEQFLPGLEEAFMTAFSMTTPLDVIFPEVLRNCYAEYGWSNSSTIDSPGVKPFGMHEFICAFRREVLRSNYDAESRQNLLSGGTYRFQSLLNANKYLFDTDKSISFEKLLNGYSVIELDAIDNPEHKALVMSLIMMQLRLVIRHNQKKDSILKNVVLLDEAHVILGGSDYTVKKNEADPSGKIRESYLAMTKVNRAYGTGMIFSDQSLTILEDFVNNADVKITMHLENAEERRFLAHNLGFSEEVYENINSLKIGQFYLSGGDIKEPLLVQAPDTRKELSLPHDVSDETVASSMKVEHARPFEACPCRKNCNIEIRNEAEFIARRLIGQLSDELLNDKSLLEKYIKLNLNDAISPMTEDSDNEKRLAKCARLQFERMIKQKTGFLI